MSDTWHRQETGIADMDEVDGEPELPMSRISTGFPMVRHPKMMGDSEDPKQRCESGFYDSGLGSVGSNLSQEYNMSALLSGLKVSESLSSTKSSEIAPVLNDEGFSSESLKFGESPAFGVTKPTQIEPVQKVEQGLPNQLELFDQDEDGDTQLHIAIAQMLPAVAMRIIELAPGPEYLNVGSCRRHTPLHLAVITNQPNVTRYLVCHGARLDAQDVEGNTPLHIACREGYLSCVKALAMPLTISESYSARQLPVQQIPQDMDLRNYEGNTCMHLATYKCQVDVLNFLLKQPIDADVNTRDGCSGRTLLHHAVEANNQSLVLFLINVCGAEVSAMTYDGSTPMKLAEGRGLQHLVRILMHYGADQSQILTDSDSDSSSDEEMGNSYDGTTT